MNDVPGEGFFKEFDWRVRCRGSVYGLRTDGVRPRFCVRCGRPLALQDVTCLAVLMIEPETEDKWKEEKP